MRIFQLLSPMHRSKSPSVMAYNECCSSWHHVHRMLLQKISSSYGYGNTRPPAFDLGKAPDEQEN